MWWYKSLNTDRCYIGRRYINWQCCWLQVGSQVVVCVVGHADRSCRCYQTMAVRRLGQLDGRVSEPAAAMWIVGLSDRRHHFVQHRSVSLTDGHCLQFYWNTHRGIDTVDMGIFLTISNRTNFWYPLHRVFYLLCSINVDGFRKVSHPRGWRSTVLWARCSSWQYSSCKAQDRHSTVIRSGLPQATADVNPGIEHGPYRLLGGDRIHSALQTR